MTRKRRSFQRPLGERRYKKMFIISMEGAITEPKYFALFNQSQSVIRINCIKRKSTNSSPNQVLKAMQDYLRKESIRSNDEAWIVVDKDDWTDNQLNELREWAKGNTNYFVAISNPHFEYFLLLHFEDGNGLSNNRDCITRLKKHLPDYNKDIDSKKITPDRIQKAIDRSKKKSEGSSE